MVVLTVPAVFKLLVSNSDLEHTSLPVDWYWLGIVFVIGGVAAWLLQHFRQPNPWLFGPLLITAGASIWFDLHVGLPFGASQLGQLLIGSSLGCFFERSFFRDAPAFLARSFISTCAMVITASVAAAEAIQAPFDREITGAKDAPGRLRVQKTIDSLSMQAKGLVAAAAAIGITQLTLVQP